MFSKSLKTPKTRLAAEPEAARNLSVWMLVFGGAVVVELSKVEVDDGVSIDAASGDSKDVSVIVFVVVVVVVVTTVVVVVVVVVLRFFLLGPSTLDNSILVAVILSAQDVEGVDVDICCAARAAVVK